MRGRKGGSKKRGRAVSQEIWLQKATNRRTGRARAYKFHEIYDMFPQKFIALQIEERYETNVGLAYQLHSVMVKKQILRV